MELLLWGVTEVKFIIKCDPRWDIQALMSACYEVCCVAYSFRWQSSWYDIYLHLKTFQNENIITSQPFHRLNESPARITSDQLLLGVPWSRWKTGWQELAALSCPDPAALPVSSQIPPSPWFSTPGDDWTHVILSAATDIVFTNCICYFHLFFTSLSSDLISDALNVLWKYILTQNIFSYF